MKEEGKRWVKGWRKKGRGGWRVEGRQEIEVNLRYKVYIEVNPGRGEKRA